MKSKLNPILKKYERMFYVSGLATGFMISLLIHFIFNYFDIDEWGMQTRMESSVIHETNAKLLSFIEGIWNSPVNDMYIDINVNTTKNIFIIEIFNEMSNKKQFKIMNVDRVDGMLGLVSLEICDATKPCTSQSDMIPIQINKIFGIPNTITLLYDSRVSLCLEPGGECVRAFKKRT